MTKVSGPLIINLDSTMLSNHETNLLTENIVGGVILFDHNYSNKQQIKSLISSIKSIKNDILVAVDHEGGRVQRFKNNFTMLPSFSDIGILYLSDNKLADEIAYNSGYIAGYELAEIGIDINFSPVIDLTSDSRVLYGRTFSSSYEIIIRLASKYIEGLLDNGVLPTLKHFPGHGAVPSDTHTDVSTCDLSYEDLTQHISPFKYLHGIYNIPIMTSHVIYNSVSDSPVTVSSKWLSNLSESIFKSKPFFVSDDLEMGAIVNNIRGKSKLEILNQSLINGCNMVIVTTMQNRELIDNKISYKFYKNEYIENHIEIINEKFYNIDLPSIENITYNKRDARTYQKAIESLKGLF